MSETPEWFWEAIDIKPESGFVEVEDCDVNYLSWKAASDEALNNGLLFVHGHNAHAHWWDFIAPFFKDEYKTVALDLTGMGDSDHRDAYSNDIYAKEIIAVAGAAELPDKTVLVAHSFGGMMAIRTVAQHPERFKGLILVDTGVRHPEDIKEREMQVDRLARAKFYPTREIAHARFRLQPPQQCDNQYIVDHIARNSIEYDSDEEGWSWKFDEELNSRMTHEGSLEADYKNIGIPAALIYGAQSESFKARSAGYMKELNSDLTVLEIADARHHLFLDQPMAFVESVKAILAGWDAS
ncbi:MAG: alpha/beta hydrolase [Pseudomonadales bacterium]|nr:alpha/beta hydrolase [Pseudomonadales bacterium]